MTVLIAGAHGPSQGVTNRSAPCRLMMRDGQDPSLRSWGDGATTLAATGGGLCADSERGVAVVADATFYDHADLADRLGEPRSASTARLILVAFLRWGEDCPALFYGDFAFAIWDARERRLFCARDPFGIRPLYYSARRGNLEFASSAGQLLEAGEQGQLRDSAVADFLFGRVFDSESTFYEGIERLPAAHSLSFADGQLSLRRYWHLQPGALPPEGDCPEMFRDIFTHSVASRMHGANAPGALLSGGLDSSSIACVARDHLSRAGRGLLPTFSAVFEKPAHCNERRYVDAVLEQGGFSPTIFLRDDYAPLSGMERLLRDLDGPVLAPNLACMRPVLDEARDAGIDVLLEGHGGDEVVSHGYGLLDELAGAGRWLKLWRESAAAADNYGGPPWPLLLGILKRHDRPGAKMLARVLRPFAGQASAQSRHLLKRDLIERSSLRERMRAGQRSEPGSGEQRQHIATLSEPLQSYAFEVLAASYRSAGLEARYPFWDKRLVEFCVSLPSSEKLDGGWSRLVLRRAMAEIIPEAVARRRDKVDFTHHLSCGLVRHHNEEIMDLLTDRQGSLGSYVDLESALTTYREIAQAPEKASGPDVQAIWRAVTLGIWLRLRRAGGSERPGDARYRNFSEEKAA